GTAGAYHNLGSAYRAAGNLVVAKGLYSRALEIRKSQTKGGLLVANSLNSLGVVSLQLGQLVEAQSFHERALRILEISAPESLEVIAGLMSLALAHKRLDNPNRSLELYDQALARIQMSSPGSLEMARALNSIGRIYSAEPYQQPERARGFLLKAIEALEQQVSQLGGAYQAREEFRSSYTRFYDDLVALDLRFERDEEAFYVLERSRAQGYLERLTERDKVFSLDIPEELDQARRSLAVKRDRLQQRLARTYAEGDSASAAGIREEIEVLKSEARDVEARIREASPKLASLQYPTPLGFEAARSSLDDGTLLVSYSVGESEVVFFSFSKEFGLLVDSVEVGVEDLKERVRALVHSIGYARVPGSQRMRRFESLSKEMFGLVLAPVAERIEKSRRVLIVADGPLHNVPWGALIRETDQGDQYVAAWKPVHLSASATVYSETLKMRPWKGEERAMEFIGFGDPLYPGSLEAAFERGDSVVRSLSERLSLGWEPLPFTRSEVEGIANLFLPSGRRVFLGSEAVEERLKSGVLRARFLHIAAHAYLDETFPESSFIALAMPEPVGGSSVPRESENGILQVWEILERVRIESDLVVLSACSSGLGKELGNEGLVGLTRAFQYAGARSVVASLWNVADHATAELMIRFYRHLRSGASKDEALRAAQLELLEGPIEISGDGGKQGMRDISAPYFWAGFQIYGDWF
ncbi:MAG: CHAT domain-containing protein, partial [Acidobacteriota bacterium]